MALFLDLILLIDPWKRQYICDIESGGLRDKSSARSTLAGLVCVVVHCLPVPAALGALGFTAW